MSSMALRTPAWRVPISPWRPDPRRVLAIAIVIGLHLALAMRLWMPSTPLLERARTPPPPEVPVDIDRLPPPPPRPEPPRPIERRPVVTPPVTPPTTVRPIETPPVTTAHAEPSDQPVVPVSPIRPAVPALPPGPPAVAPLVVEFAPQPIYPRRELNQGIGGEVRLRILVGTQGRADAVEVERSSGRDALDQAAMRVVRQRWRFQAAEVNGQPVARWGVVSIRFKPER